MNRILPIALCLLCLCGNICFSQSIFNNIKYQAEAGTFLSTSGQTPFWLRSNQYGIVPIEAQFLTVRGAAHKEYDSTKNDLNKQHKFSYGYGLNTVMNVGKANQILIPEAYLKVRYRAFEFYAGRRKEIVGLVDTTLTSGSYIWSGNALPIPKIQISIPNYTSIIGHGLVSIKGAYAHGWFDNGVVKNFYLHQKWIYGRIGKPNWKIKFYGGFNHQVQWGGRPKVPFIDAQTGNLINKYSSNFNTYLKVVSGVSVNRNDNGIETGLPINDVWNRAGNHLGTIDIATEINFKKVNLFLYRQSIYEDGSLFYLNNIADGLLGIALTRIKVKKGLFKVCVEYFNSTSQGGAIGSESTIPQLRGQDNYFTNALYLNGWTYKKNVIGTPFIVPIEAIDIELTRKYNLKSLPSTFIMNSRIKMWQIVGQGSFSNINYLSKIALSNNYGSFNFEPFFTKQYSFSQQINYTLSKYLIISSFSMDIGKLYANNLGFYFGVRRTFL